MVNDVVKMVFVWLIASPGFLLREQVQKSISRTIKRQLSISIETYTNKNETNTDDDYENYNWYFDDSLTVPDRAEFQESNYDRKQNLVKHLKKVSKVQLNIVKILTKIEKKSKEVANSNCHVDNLSQQKKAIAALKGSLLDVQIPDLNDPISLLTRKRRNLDHELMLASKERARIIQELNSFNYLDSNDKEASSLLSGETQDCKDIKQRAREVIALSNQLRKKVVERRKQVVKYLAELAKDLSLYEKLLKDDKSMAEARVAGYVALERCKRCEELDHEAVCGANGKTYRTLCHAANCAGLSLADITAGPCISKNVCANSQCNSGQFCVPMIHGTCLSMYSRDGLHRLNCRQYVCVEENCNAKNYSHICGEDDRTYPSICHLHQAKVQLAYTGECRPNVCTGQVCGADKNTYKSSCHARARKIRIDYKGKCFSKKKIHFTMHLSTCITVRKLGLCQKATLCNNPVVPADACCPICGGAVQLAMNAEALSKFIAERGDNNHVYILENFFRNQLPDYAKRKCDLYGYLTTSGNLSLLLEALNPGDHLLCEKALLQVTTIDSHNDSKPGQRQLKTAALFEGIIRNEIVNIQNRAIRISGNIRNDASNKFKGSIYDIDQRLNHVPQNGERTHMLVDLFPSLTAVLSLTMQ